jgi:hypothetical protein
MGFFAPSALCHRGVDGDAEQRSPARAGVRQVPIFPTQNKYLPDRLEADTLERFQRRLIVHLNIADKSLISPVAHQGPKGLGCTRAAEPLAPEGHRGEGLVHIDVVSSEMRR